MKPKISSAHPMITSPTAVNNYRFSLVFLFIRQLFLYYI
nr:MAG TPA: hypothetical protein [Bacteriophage sp.]